MLEDLIKQGQMFTFSNNSKTNSTGTYGKASDELLGWAANVEDFIRENYGETSGPYQLYSSFDRTRLTGYYESDFSIQITILMGALKACRQIQPKKKTKLKDDHPVTCLIKNIYFWPSITSVSAVAFMLGIYFGTSKFDKEKSEYYDQTKRQEKELNEIKTIDYAKDSTIKILKNKITRIQDSLINKK